MFVFSLLNLFQFWPGFLWVLTGPYFPRIYPNRVKEEEAWVAGASKPMKNSCHPAKLVERCHVQSWTCWAKILLLLHAATWLKIPHISFSLPLQEAGVATLQTLHSHPVCPRQRATPRLQRDGQAAGGSGPEHWSVQGTWMIWMVNIYRIRTDWKSHINIGFEQAILQHVTYFQSCDIQAMGCATFLKS